MNNIIYNQEFEFVQDFTNTLTVYLIDKIGIRSPIIFSEFTGEIIQKSIPIIQPIYRYIKLIKLTNCNCYLVMNNNKIKLNPNVELNIDLINLKENLIYLELICIDSNFHWNIQIIWTNKINFNLLENSQENIYINKFLNKNKLNFYAESCIA